MLLPRTDDSTAMRREIPMLCIGHSHVASLAAAASQQGLALTAINFWYPPGALVRENDKWKLSDETRQRIGRHAGPVFSLIGGACYAQLGMLVHPRPWDFVLPTTEELPLAPDTELIPYDAVKQVLSGLMQEYLEITLQVRDAATNALFHIEPPPPCADAKRMLPHIPWPLFPGMRREIAPALFRYKLWRLQSSILEAQCKEHGIGFVRYPDIASDEQGFLAPAYFGDGAHGNPAYGALVLEQIRWLHEASV
jgi:hypothetical protein